MKKRVNFHPKVKILPSLNDFAKNIPPSSLNQNGKTLFRYYTQSPSIHLSSVIPKIACLKRPRYLSNTILAQHLFSLICFGTNNKSHVRSTQNQNSLNRALGAPSTRSDHQIQLGTKSRNLPLIKANIQS